MKLVRFFIYESPFFIRVHSILCSQMDQNLFIIITCFFDLWGNDTKGYGFSGKMIRRSGQRYTYAEISSMCMTFFSPTVIFILLANI